MNVLILNHHFNQDIHELEYFNSNMHTIKLISPNYFANQAKRLFPKEVFGADLKLFFKEQYNSNRRKYREIAFKLIYDIYKIYQFDLFIIPSDTFFYIRDVIDACEDINIPVVVIQKELGVSKYSLENHASQIFETFPVKCSWMTTCSEESKKFWIKAGGDGDKISVIGQPRFDYYFRNNSSDKLLLNVDIEKTKILFLSYDLDAYSEDRTAGKLLEPWKKIHEDTLNSLLKIASCTNSIIYIKPHPQYYGNTLSLFFERIKDQKNIVLLQGNIDTRKLLKESDIIIGFQTTTILEAMIIGQKVIYTYWTDDVKILKDKLLPYHEMNTCLTIADSALSLEELLLNSSNIIGGDDISDEQLAERKRYFSDFFGPIDGRSSQRAWLIIEQVYNYSLSNLNSFHLNRRKMILNQKCKFIKKQIVVSKYNLIKLKIIKLIYVIPFKKHKVNKVLKESIELENIRLKECLIHDSNREIIGETSFSLYWQIINYCKIKL